MLIVLVIMSRLIRELERGHLKLNRAIEFLPDDETLAERVAGNVGLTRPELAVLLAYAKMALYDSLLESELPDDGYFGGDLAQYFPPRLRETYAQPISEHRLRREIVVTGLVNNMVTGVTDGFKKELEIVGVGYRAEAQGPNALRLNLGFSHPVNVAAPEGISFEVPVPTQVIVSGIDKEVVGQVAADIRSIRKPEPYKGKGVRYAGERVMRKGGKAGKK